MARLLRQVYKACLVLSLCLAGLLVAGLIFPVLARVAGGRGKMIRERIAVAWFRLMSVCLKIKVEIAGTPIIARGLLPCNHISWLDVIVLGARRPVTFVAKSEVRRWPVFGYLAKQCGTLFLRRGQSLATQLTADRMTWLLRQGGTLALFPEGTTSPGDRVLRFHPRLFQPAVWSGAEVQAVAISYGGAARGVAPFVGDEELLPHLVRLLALKRIDVRLHFCPPMPATGTTRTALARRTHAQVCEALEHATVSACLRGSAA